MGPREINQAAFRNLKPRIDQEYSHGRFVAIDGGQIVADAADIRALLKFLTAKGLNTQDVLVVQAGYAYPEYVDILI
jgi:hypothetical protein